MNSMNTHETFFKNLWNDYVQISPSTEEIHNLFLKKEPTVANDHVAFRTFNQAPINLQAFRRCLEPMGYKPKGEYHFEKKKLYAQHFENEQNPDLPKIFVSELLVEKLSPEAQSIIQKLVAKVPADFSKEASFMYSGRPWECSKQDYDKLLQESEYAAWMAAFGFHANHFTVFINKLNNFDSVESVNQFIEASGFSLNSSGGKIKGSPAEYLEQSSTLAREVLVQFSDGEFSIPGCYYEFAKRYPLENNQLYQGFVAQSADKIFESTDTQ